MFNINSRQKQKKKGQNEQLKEKNYNLKSFFKLRDAYEVFGAYCCFGCFLERSSPSWPHVCVLKFSSSRKVNDIIFPIISTWAM